MIRQDEVHLFHTPLDLPKGELDRLSDLLCESEKERAGRFYHLHHRNHFISAHGILRTILSRYTGKSPEKLCFTCNSHGKPELENANGNPKIRFNLSHSHGVALYGICLDRRIGVDIEYIRPLSDMESIVSRHFSVRESSEIRDCPEHIRNELFYRCWTMKEAYLKATGVGLSGLSEIEIMPGPSAMSCSKVEHVDTSGITWSIYPVQVPPGYTAALAVDSTDALPKSHPMALILNRL